jgi:F-type H+-transporting ATPase subunit gamma
MPSLKVIRTRISSVKSTQKITKAMKMVAGARLARAQARIVALRPYAVKTAEVLRSVAASMAEADDAGSTGGEYEAPTKAVHPLLAKRPEKKVLFLVMSSDRGLCGAFNTNINKAVEREWVRRKDQGVTVEFATCGRKSREYVQRRSGKVDNDFAKIYDGLDMEKAKVVAEWIVPRFLKAEFDAVYVVYNEFKSAISQEVRFERLLPLPDAPAPAKADAAAGTTEFLYEPDPQSLLERLVPMYIEITVYRALLESQASEFGARMSAMDAATRNAKDMIGRLTLIYNRARQAAITKELMEIIGGAEALKE